MSIFQYRVIHEVTRDNNEYYKVRRYLFGLIPWTHFTHLANMWSDKEITEYGTLEKAEKAIEEHLEWISKPKVKVLDRYIYRREPQVHLSIPPVETLDANESDRLQKAILELKASTSIKQREIGDWLQQLQDFRKGLK